MEFLAIEPDLSAVLREHFPDIDEREIATWSGRIFEDWIPAKALEELVKGDRPSLMDIKDLRLASRRLRNAQKILRQLGGHGNDALLAIRGDRQVFRDATDTIFGNAPEFVICEIENIALQLESAASQLRSDEPSLGEVFGDKDPKANTNGGRRRKTAAREVAISCGAVFQNLTGRRPTVSTWPSSGEAYGDFLNFVESVFEILQIKASAETFAREVTKDI